MGHRSQYPRLVRGFGQTLMDAARLGFRPGMVRCFISAWPLPFGWSGVETVSRGPRCRWCCSAFS